MYGDTGAIRAMAGAARARAEEVRCRADALAARTAAVRWQGAAADALRARAADHAGDMREVATAHDRVAESLERHADRVEDTQELIAATERRVLGLVAAARERATALGGALSDPVDLLYLRFAAPPSGHLSWLAVDLPGAR